LIAVDVETGKMVRHYQTSPHDTHDWDATQTPVLVDAPFGGRLRKLVMQATRNGYFFVLDRVTGKHLLTSKLGKVNKWASHLDREGHPRRNPQKDATVPGSLVKHDCRGREVAWRRGIRSSAGLLSTAALRISTARPVRQRGVSSGC
jgi:glucose dehydrogenase